MRNYKWIFLQNVPEVLDWIQQTMSLHDHATYIITAYTDFQNADASKLQLQVHSCRKSQRLFDYYN